MSANTSQGEFVRSYSKDRAFSLARMLTNKGLPSEPYPHPSGDGTYAIRAVEKPNLEFGNS